MPTERSKAMAQDYNRQWWNEDAVNIDAANDALTSLLDRRAEEERQRIRDIVGEECVDRSWDACKDILRRIDSEEGR
ncbi:MAG: hypothetical protein PHS14_13025 [Elusimicrobia bacterium]|nr:hypothetical protein [Elusimicrobiota bacterium]